MTYFRDISRYLTPFLLSDARLEQQEQWLEAGRRAMGE
jgi:hypothetical protein